MFHMKNKTKYVYILNVLGMRCGMCEMHLEDLIRKNFDVKKVKADRFKNNMTIYSNIELDLNEVESAINKSGYQVERR